jgi:hypothetical protein
MVAGEKRGLSLRKTRIKCISAKEENSVSLPPQVEYSVPEETQHVARVIFPNRNLYMQ